MGHFCIKISFLRILLLQYTYVMSTFNRVFCNNLLSILRRIKKFRACVLGKTSWDKINWRYLHSTYAQFHISRNPRIFFFLSAILIFYLKNVQKNIFFLNLLFTECYNLFEYCAFVNLWSCARIKSLYCILL